MYIDQIFVMNFFTDLILIHISSGLVSCKKVRRTLLASVIGAVYATAMYISGLEFLSAVYIRIAVFVLMAVIAFRPKNFMQFLKGVMIFAGVSVFFGGSVFAVLAMSGYSITEIRNNSIAVFDATTPVMLICFSVVAIFVYGIIRLIYRQVVFSSKLTNIEIRHSGRRVCVCGLIDTGCTLQEPENNRPVIIVDSKYADSFLREVGESLMIPYSTVGNNGIFLGFYPDYIKVGKKVLHDVAVAVCYSDALKGKQYSAIINSDVLKERDCFAGSDGTL